MLRITPGSLIVTGGLSAAGSRAGAEFGIEDTELEEDELTAGCGAGFGGGGCRMLESSPFVEDDGQIQGVEDVSAGVCAGAGPNAV